VTVDVDAKVVELAVDSRAVIEPREVTLIRAGRALTFRRREIDKFIAAYERTNLNAGGKS
jgi:hypothetical protein